jgi:hypothetical protein
MAIILDDGPLTPYANGLMDRSYAAKDESIFGHLVVERGCSLQDALENLAPEVKRAYRTTELAKQWLPMLGGGTLLGSIGIACGVGIGFGLIPVLPAIGTLFLWNQTVDEWKVRSAEYQLHRKIFPAIPSLMFALAEHGATPEELIGAYDGLVEAIGNRIMSNREVSAADVRSFLEGKITEYRSNGNVFSEMEDRSFESAEPLPATTLENPIATAAAAPTVLGGSATPIVTQESSIAVAPSFAVMRNMDPVDVLVDALFSNRAMYGVQRGGKTAYAAKSSAKIVIKDSSIKIFYINVFAADLSATKSMFAHAYRSVIYDLAPIKPFYASAVIEEAAKVFDEFVQTEGAILVLDEASSIGNVHGRHFEALSPLVDELVGYLSAIRGSTRKRRQAIWTIAPEIVAGSLGQGMKSLMKGFPPVFIAIPKNRNVTWQGQKIVHDTTLQGQLEINYKPLKFAVPEIDCDRVCFIDGTWMPMGDCTIPKVPTQAVQPVPEDTTPTPSPEPSTWVGEGRSDAPQDSGQWDSLMTAIAVMAFNSSGLDQQNLLHAAKLAKELDENGQRNEAFELLKQQLPS